jgi:serine/threonine protein kinase
VVVKRLLDPLAKDSNLARVFLAASDLSRRLQMRQYLATVAMAHRSREGVFLIREYIDGSSLASLHQGGWLAMVDLCQATFDLCEAVRALHAQGIVHGGIHPGNVIVQRDDRLRLTDFAIGRASLTHQVDAAYPPGALRYLAPEQWQGEPPTVATDLYACALVIALLLERREVIDGTSHDEIHKQVLSGCRTGCLPLDTALKPDPRQRYPDLDHFREALQQQFAPGQVLPGLASTVPAQEVVSPPVPPPFPDATPTQGGSLVALVDLKNKQDLLSLNHGQPWVLPRTGTGQQWPILFRNAGPGELVLQVRCLGQGLCLTPVDHWKIPPGQARYAIVNLDAQGSDFARLSFLWEGQRPSERIEVRLYRSPQPAN